MEEERTYRVLPDTSLVIGFQYKGSLWRVDNNLETPLSISGISGLADHSRIFKNAAGIGTVLVFFKETGAASAFPGECFIRQFYVVLRAGQNGRSVGFRNF